MNVDIASPMVILLNFMIDTWVIWLILTVFFLVAEILTVDLVAIWFAIGSLAAIVASLLGAGIWLQIVIMLFVSGFLLIGFLIIRPRLGLTDQKNIPTNADRYVGQTAVVIQDIDPVTGTGQVKSLGQIWSAVSADDTRIPEGTMTVITQIRGVKAVVRLQQHSETGEEPVS